MNNSKIIAVFFAAAAALLPLCGAPKKFSVKATPVKSIYKIGEKIEFDLEVTHPGDYQLSAWQVVVSETGTPAKYVQKWNKWGSLNLPPIYWVHQPSLQKNSIRTGFAAKDFVPGDYNFGIVARLYRNGDYKTNPKLLSTMLNITLEAPAASSAAPADKKFLCEVKNLRHKVSKAENGDLVCSATARLVSTSEDGACFLVKTSLIGADGKSVGAGEQIIGIRGKQNQPIKFSASAKTPGKYRFNIEFWSNSSAPVLLKSFASDVELK